MSARTATLSSLRRSHRALVAAIGALGLVATSLIAASPAHAAGSNTITVTPISNWVTEGGVAWFQISASEPITVGSNPHPGVVPQTVHYNTRNAAPCVAAPTGCADDQSDYVSTSGTLNFDAGHTSYFVSVQTNDDPTTEPNEAFSLTTDAGGIASEVILDNDPDGYSVFYVGGQSGNEQFRVVRSSAPSSATTVRVSTQDGSAHAPTDYTAVNTLVTIPAHSTVSPVVTVATSCGHQFTNASFTMNLSSTARGQRIVGDRATGRVLACIH